MEGEATDEAEDEVAEDEVEAKWASYSARGRRRMLGGIIMMLGLGGGVSCPGPPFPPLSFQAMGGLIVALCVFGCRWIGKGG